jgi:2,3-dihydroxybenzoate decarboxylase
VVQELDVPVYLHPRSPAGGQPAYEGHEWLAGSVWGFAAETSVHALRLMGSGLFDQYPALRIIVGHLGEGLTFNLWRVDHRLATLRRGEAMGRGPRARQPLTTYLRGNFYVTTSGNFHTPALANVIAEVGVDRILYSVDYPFEDMAEAAAWFDAAPLDERDRLKIAQANARALLRL